MGYTLKQKNEINKNFEYCKALFENSNKFKNAQRKNFLELVTYLNVIFLFIFEDSFKHLFISNKIFVALIQEFKFICSGVICYVFSVLLSAKIKISSLFKHL